MKEQSSNKGKARTVLLAVLCVLTSVMIVGTQLAWQYEPLINTYLGTSSTEILETNPDGSGDTQYFKSSYDSFEDLHAYEEELCAEIEREGAVLVENNGLLPISAESRVTLLGRASVDIVYGGTGAGGVDAETCDTMQSALESRGITINPEMYSFYQSVELERVTAGWANPDSSWLIGECPVEDFSEEAVASCEDYQDAAIVVISRSGGEGADLPQGDFGDGSKYLALQETEQDLLRFANEHFSNVIVLLNTQNALELDWILDEQYGVDACLWIGTVGQTGLQGVADLLVGNATPSGHFTDTYAADSLSSAAIQNSGKYTYTNIDEITALNPARNEQWTVDGVYLAELEGIYVGYRYYETRYEDLVLGQGNADSQAGAFASSDGWNYDEEICYPFGYGLSYTTFEQQLDSVIDEGEQLLVSVTVTNTGDTYSGKDVVQVYFQSEYNEYDRQNQIEKASANLCGFAKTDELAPGESQTLTITVPKEEFIVYDEYGYDTYIMDSGDYYLAIGNDVHDALNNILALKGMSAEDGMDAAGNAGNAYTWNVPEIDAQTYSVSAETGYEITNQFEKSELKDYGYENIVTLTRNDWNTFPHSLTGIEANEELIHDTLASGGDFYENEGTGDPSSFLLEQDNGLSLIDMQGKDYDDPDWELLLEQMSLDEMINLITNSGWQTPAVESILKPATLDRDGTSGFTGNFVTEVSTIAYQSEVLVASTWNTDLLTEMGACIGEDGIYTGISGWYGPAMNLHRTPYSGRNYEYYSEDSFLSGKLAAAEIAAAQEKGLYAYAKHFALNDQETERHGYAVFISEQAIREIYLKPFKDAVTEGGTNGIMSSFNRIGGTWAGAHYGLLTEVLRNEWGFDGFVLTDAANTPYMSVLSGLMAGNDIWLAGAPDIFRAELENANPGEDLQLLNAMRQAVHRCLYVQVNSSAMNGISPTAELVHIMPWWKILIIVVDVILALGTLFVMISSIRSGIKGKAENPQGVRTAIITVAAALILIALLAVLISIAASAIITNFAV